MTNIVNDCCYGKHEFGEILQSIAEKNNFTPIQNMFEWSKEYYDENFNIYPATIAHFIAMIVDEKSSDETTVAGWILTLNAMLTSKKELADNGMPRDIQTQLFNELFKKVQEKSDFVYYHVNNYFHQHPAFAKNFLDKP